MWTGLGAAVVAAAAEWPTLGYNALALVHSLWSMKFG